MSEVARRTLRGLIARHGPGLCSDARRCEALLRDLCGGQRREINILMGALEERVPLDLLAARGSMPRDLLLARLAKRLEDHLALTVDAARWAVESWALALGVVTDAELEESNRRPAEAAPPKSPAPRPAVEDDAETNRPAPRANAPTPPQRPTPPPPSPAPRVSRTASGRPPTATRPAPAGVPAAAAPRAPSFPQATHTGGLQLPPAEPTAGGGRRRWRGCLIGCLLLALLSVLLVAGAPFVFNVLREEQQQRNLEPPPARSQ